MVSQAGLNLWYGYLKITGSTGALARNAPVLKDRMKLPFVVVPSMETEAIIQLKQHFTKVCVRYIDRIKLQQLNSRVREKKNSKKRILSVALTLNRFCASLMWKIWEINVHVHHKLQCNFTDYIEQECIAPILPKFSLTTKMVLSQNVDERNQMFWNIHTKETKTGASYN